MRFDERPADDGQAPHLFAHVLERMQQHGIFRHRVTSPVSLP